MKIRTDFVTNSSSSSFVLEIGIELKDGTSVAFYGQASCGEGAPGDFGELEMTVSPKQLGNAKSVQALVDMLKNGVVDSGFMNKNLRIMDEQDADRRKEADEAQAANRPISEAYDSAVDFVRRVAAIPDMDDVKKITVTGNEYNYRNYLRTYVYDRATNTYTKEVKGFEFDKNGGSGGDLIFADEAQAVTKTMTADAVNYLFFKNRRFVTTGFTDAENERIKSKIEARGGVFGQSVGPQTYCLIVNEKYGRTTEKYDAAVAFNKGTDSTFMVLGKNLPPEKPRPEGEKIRIINQDMLNRFLQMQEGELLDPSIPVKFTFSPDPVFLNFRNRRFVIAGFSETEKRNVENEIIKRGGIVDAQIGPDVYCLILNGHCRKMMPEYEDVVVYKYKCHILSDETFHKYLALPEGTPVDPTQPPYIKKRWLIEASALVTELDLSDSGVTGVESDALCSCKHLKKLILPTGNLTSNVFAHTEIDELRFTVFVSDLKKRYFGDRPLPPIRMPLATIEKCTTPESKQALICSFLSEWAGGGVFDQALQEGYDKYLRSQRKKFLENDTAVRYLAQRGLLPKKEALELAQSMLEAGKEELAAILEQCAAAAAEKKKSDATAGSEQKKPKIPAKLSEGNWKAEKLPDDTLVLTGYAGNDEKVEIPSTLRNIPVTAIGNGLFSAYGKKQDRKAVLQRINTVVIPDGITNIGYQAFFMCTELRNLTIPNSVTSIGSAAFSGCKSLKSVSIPSGVTSIGSFAFSDCNGLISVTIPNSVTSIGEFAFENCRGLKSVSIPSGVTSIGSSAFSGCKSLKNVSIPDNVTNIGSGTFEDCTLLMSVMIPDSVTSIHHSAFNNSHPEICAPAGSYAERFAKENGLRFKAT